MVMVGMDIVRRRLPRLAVRAGLALVVTAVTAACGGKDDGGPVMATPTVTLGKTRASLGSPLDVTYKFVVAPGATFDKDYRVFVHFVNERPITPFLLPAACGTLPTWSALMSLA